jgi:hypothetical protein
MGQIIQLPLSPAALVPCKDWVDSSPKQDGSFVSAGRRS